MVLLDDEDFELADIGGWFIGTLWPTKKPFVARTETANGRGFRVALHRLVAVRMKPELIRKKFRAIPINGNYLDCRRENLAITVRKPRRGHPGIEPRPKGWFKRHHTGAPRDGASPLWAGGYTYKFKDRRGSGGKQRIVRCIGNRPVD